MMDIAGGKNGEGQDFVSRICSRVYERIKKDGMNNIWDRFEAQGMGGDPDKTLSVLPGGHAQRFVLQWPVPCRCVQG